MLAPVPDQRRRCRRRVSPEFVRCRRECTAIEIINDQHTTVKVPIDHGRKVGDIVVLSPSHSFTTFDKWRLIWKIDDD
jgi:D-serine deaminase-like pyridoxal phosphate-dependent protein